MVTSLFWPMGCEPEQGVPVLGRLLKHKLCPLVSLLPLWPLSTGMWAASKELAAAPGDKQQQN